MKQVLDFNVKDSRLERVKQSGKRQILAPKQSDKGRRVQSIVRAQSREFYQILRGL